MKYIKENPDADLKIAFTIDQDPDDVDQFAIPVKKGEIALTDAIENALNELKADGTLGALSVKYFENDVIDYSSIEAAAEEVTEAAEG